jgi:hypothetical protein
MTGWNLPPGCTTRMIDEAYGLDSPCECCGRDTADCICEECPTCNEYGNPKCYAEGGHGLKYNRDQRIGQAKMKIYMLQQQIADEENYIQCLEDGVVELD